jgi:hypothetical protein
MNLDPAGYTCPDHHIDLTDQVRDALDEHDLPPVAYPGLHRKSKLTGPRPFAVPVICPGPGGADQSHELTCTGTWTR